MQLLIKIYSWKQYRYESVALVVGAVILILELVGARMVAPRFGASIYIWTAVIGVILAALSAGYWYGGRLADRGATDRGLALILTQAAAVLFVCLLLREPIFAVAEGMPGGLRAQAFTVALLLFAPVNFLMGTISPYLAKLKLSSLKTAGRSIGGLYAAGTTGSILGTFLAGYWLIAAFGNRSVGWALVIALLATSFLAEARTLIWQRLAIGVIMLAAAIATGGQAKEGVVYQSDGLYATYQVIDGSLDGRPARFLSSDAPGLQSGIYLDGKGGTPFRYIEAFTAVAAGRPAAADALLIGGGAYTLPPLLTAQNAGLQVTVVEIEPQLDDIAARYFGFKPQRRISIIHADGRAFLNANRSAYDLIFVDAFTGLSPPFQLTTSEAVARLRAALKPDGLVAANIIGAAEGSRNGFLRAEAATYARHFPALAVARLRPELPPGERQNVLLLAAGSDAALKSALQELNYPLLPLDFASVQPLSDDYAPVERLTGER